MIFHPPSQTHRLAEVNVAKLKAPMGSPIVAPFVDALEKVNGIAEGMDGFLWRHIDESGNATETTVSEDPLVIYNASVWRDATTLESFVWGTLHAAFYAKRDLWFEAMGAMHFAMWWVPEGEWPDPADAMDRLDILRLDGPTEAAFGWAEVPGATRWRTARCGQLEVV